VTLLLFVLGLALLVLGAELLVRGAARLAVVAGISPLVIGLTVVAFGTGAPELAVTVTATARGEPDLALGNVVGSNIANVLLILGLSALVTPLLVSRRVVRLDMPILILASVVVLVLALDGVIGRTQGGALLAAGIAYTILLIRHARRTSPREPREPWAPKRRRRRAALDVAWTVGGLVLLVVGSRWLVEAAREIAVALGISQLAIGLTVVAIGTSLPELATSVVAGIRGQRDIAVGNIIGSNLFNLLIVLGVAASISPQGIAASPIALAFDMPIMLAATIACLPIFFTGRIMTRWEGLLFLAYFVGYTAYVLLIATGHPGLILVRHALLFFAIPLGTLSLLICLVTARRARSRGRPA
jgi:cation:H+ antiporter